MFIDTHAHLNYRELRSELNDLLSRAVDTGIEKILVPATDLSSSYEVIELVQKHNMLYGAVGIHPAELKHFDESHLVQIEMLTSESKIVAIGEIGLDYYWKPYNADLEKHVLRQQLKIAKHKNLPVILHNRESSVDLMTIIEEEYENGKLKGQFHSFSGDAKMAKRCVDMGFYISFTGNITYKPNDKTLEAYKIIKETPLTNLLLETDTPYLPPVPYRGKRNEPAYLKYSAQKIAELKEVSIDEVARVTSDNARRLFSFNTIF
jgi:TatD DNase family protein